MNRSVLAATLAMVGANAAAGSFTPLGPAPAESEWTNVTGVSDGGAVVIGNGAFRWTSATGIVLLGPAYVSGTSHDGNILAGRQQVGSNPQMARWRGSTGFMLLGDLPGGVTLSQGHAITPEGGIIVGQGYDADGYKAVSWTSAAGLVSLGTLTGGTGYSEAYGVSPEGGVVVGVSSSASGLEAFAWTSAGGMASLGDLAGGIVNSRAYGVTRNGAVIVGGSFGANGFEAFRWTSADGMVGLGDLPGGPFESNAWGVSADGSLVLGTGRNADGDDGLEGFAWTSAGGMQTLRAFMVSRGVPLPVGWTRLEGKLSRDGRWIAGTGHDADSGRREAFIANLTDIVNTPLAGRLPATPGGTDYRAYYDADLDMTWIADPDLARTTSFGASGDGIGTTGTVSWAVAQGWIAAMNSAAYLGASDWRLPATTDLGAPGCAGMANGGTDCGYNVDISSSEMARLHFIAFGGSSAVTPGGAPSTTCGETSCLFYSGPFALSRMRDAAGEYYWSGTGAAPSAECGADHAWTFSFRAGQQGCAAKSDNAHGHAWAVRDGDISLVADSDGDQVVELSDNCTLVANPDQFDADNDGFGNRCDGDLNNSGLVTSADYVTLRQRLNTTNPVADLNHSGLVTSADFIILRGMMNQPPGPSAAHP